MVVNKTAASRDKKRSVATSGQRMARGQGLWGIAAHKQLALVFEQMHLATWHNGWLLRILTYKRAYNMETSARL